jgi:hypothetical protein
MWLYGTCAELPDESTEAVDVSVLCWLVVVEQDPGAQPVVETVPAEALAHRVPRHSSLPAVTHTNELLSPQGDPGVSPSESSTITHMIKLWTPIASSKRLELNIEHWVNTKSSGLLKLLILKKLLDPVHFR